MLSVTTNFSGGYMIADVWPWIYKTARFSLEFQKLLACHKLCTLREDSCRRSILLGGYGVGDFKDTLPSDNTLRSND